MSDPRIAELVDRLAALPETDRLFNPYSPAHDPESGIRRDNLTRFLNVMLRFDPYTLLLAEAPGYRGCKWTGIPVMSERIMLAGIKKWELLGDGYRQTSDRPDGIAEATPTILWGVVTQYLEKPPLVWNTVPLHPHKPGNEMSNRTPTVAEIRMGQSFVEAIIQLYPIERVFAVGRKAERSLHELDIPHTYLRHPSQGGKADFVAGLVDAHS